MSYSLHSRLLATKTQRPKLPQRLVRRERLLGLIDDGRHRTLTVIKAAAGFGKTSLALAWADSLARQGLRIAWVSLDADDDDPGQFLLYVTQALRDVCPEIAAEVTSLTDEVSLLRPLDMVRLLINALASVEDEIFLFLDDYHVLQHRDVAESTSFLLRHAPSNLHVVLTTRTEPALPLVRLRAQSELLEIDASALRFDVEETRRFLEQEASGGIGASDVASLHEKTEGWPVMMRIVATTSQQTGQDLAGYVRQLSSRHRPIRSHLFDMLDGLPAELVSFLLKTSVLESLCAPLCRAVTGEVLSDALFESLVARQLLLTPLDADGLWFRCHPLLRDFLQLRLEAEFADSLVDLHRRAYAWYAGEQRWTDAIRHALAVGDTAEAAGWIENCAMALLKRGELTALFAWERSIPAEFMRRQVKARLAIAWGMALAMRFDEAVRLAAEIETDLGETRPEVREALGCECQTIRAVALALNDNSEMALALAEDSLRRRSSGRWTNNVACNVAMIGHWKNGDIERCFGLPWIASPGEDGGRNVVATVYRHCLLGLIEYEQLNSTAAARQFREAMRVASAHSGPNSAAAAQPACLIALCLYEQGKLDEAEAMLAGRLALIAAVCMIECVLHAYTVLVRIAVQRGQREVAEDLLDQAAHLAQLRHWPRLESMVLRERVRLALRAGAVAQAESSLSRLNALAERIAGGSPALSRSVQDDLDLSHALLAIVQDRPANARLPADQMQQRSSISRSRSVALQAAALQALLVENGNTAISTALHLAASGERAQVLIDIFQFAKHPLPLELQSLPASDFRTRLEAGLLLPAEAGTKRHNAAANLLSPREENILQLAANGMSNKDIARELKVAPETIKTHMKRIFSKMNVSTRGHAISKYFQSA